MLNDLFNSGSLPVLERVVQYTEARQRLLANNIAHLSTPFYKPVDVPPASFQAALGQAIDRRRAGGNPATGPLEMVDGDGMRFRAGGVDLEATPRNDNILFHDQNNRDVERLMQQLAENALTHRTAVELMRSEIGVLEMAIRGRL